MMVASIAPISRKAARPANKWVASQAATHTSTSTSAPTLASPCLLWPSVRQIASYRSQNTTRNASAPATAAPGLQTNTLGSIR